MMIACLFERLCIDAYFWTEIREFLGRPVTETEARMIARRFRSDEMGPLFAARTLLRKPEEDEEEVSSDD